jgi:hypothetical protein
MPEVLALLVVCLTPVLVLATRSQCWRHIHAPNLSLRRGASGVTQKVPAVRLNWRKATGLGSRSLGYFL